MASNYGRGFCDQGVGLEQSLGLSKIAWDPRYAGPGQDSLGSPIRRPHYQGRSLAHAYQGCRGQSRTWGHFPLPSLSLMVAFPPLFLPSSLWGNGMESLSLPGSHIIMGMHGVRKHHVSPHSNSFCPGLGVSCPPQGCCEPV